MSTVHAPAAAEFVGAADLRYASRRAGTRPQDRTDGLTDFCRWWVRPHGHGLTAPEFLIDLLYGHGSCNFLQKKKRESYNYNFNYFAEYISNNFKMLECPRLGLI